MLKNFFSQAVIAAATVPTVRVVNVPLKNIGELTILPFKSLKKKDVPFRHSGKWYRRSNRKGDKNYAIRVDVKHKNGRLKVKDFNCFKPSQKMEGGSLVAVFTELLTEAELRVSIGAIQRNE